MDVTQQAVDAALSRNWKLAVELNSKALKQNSKDIEALNRLGRAYLELGQKTKASEIYTKVLKLDKFNSIASKNLELLKTMKVHRSSGTVPLTTAPIFLEEPGVTKTVSLTRLGDSRVISRLHAGDTVILAAREHCVAVITPDNEYLGRLPDDLAMKMRNFLKAGNRYESWVRAIEITDHASGNTKYNLRVFIKETNRANKYRNTPSFPPTEKLTYAAFTPPNLVYTDKPVVTTPEEDVVEQESEPDEDSDSPSEDRS